MKCPTMTSFLFQNTQLHTDKEAAQAQNTFVCTLNVLETSRRQTKFCSKNYFEGDREVIPSF